MDDDLIRNLENISISDFNVIKLCHSEFIRLSTYKNWVGAAFAIRLAEAGFFFTGETDRVQCYFCRIQKENWSMSDTPTLVHQKLNANCPFIVKPAETNNIPIYSNLVEESLTPSFRRIKHLLEKTRIEIDRESERLADLDSSSEFLRDSSPFSASSNTRPTMRNSSGASPRSNNLPGGSRDSSLGSSGSQDNRGGRSNGQEGGSSQQPPESVTGVPMGSQPRQGEEGSPSQTGTAPQDSPQDSPQEDPSLLRYEKNRLDTYRDFPATAHVRPQDLARAGFIYTGTADRVQCVFCRGILRDWNVGEIPHIEHKNKFPRCPFMLGLEVGNVRMTPVQPAHRINIGGSGTNQPLGHMEALGINTDRPKHGNYAVESTRLTSFNNWPRYKHQTPQQLAAAGFFYAGFGDNVKCFYCDGGLRNWEPGDDPWVEHARWFPRCSFVRTVKGDQFIRSVQERFNQANNTSGGHQVETREVRARMELPMVRAVLETGVDRNSVMKVIERRLRETGDDYPSAEALLNDVLTLEENPEAFSGPLNDSPPLDIPPPQPEPSPGHSNENVPKTGETSSSISSESGSKDLAEENRLLREQKTCKICLDAEVGVVFLPCGHLCCCVLCAPAVRQCPICRAEIRGTVRTFIP